MNIPRLYVSADLADSAFVGLDRDQTHYLASVMRRGPGDPVRLFNGRDGEWRAVVIEASRKAVVLQCDAHLRDQTIGPDLELLFAPVKKSRTDFIVEKATELGARSIRPVITAHTNSERVRTDRMAVISREAAEQTERLDLPEICDVEKLSTVLASWGDRSLIFCDEAGDAAPMLDALRHLSLSPSGEGRGEGRSPSPAINLARAKQMRNEPTRAERELWLILKQLKRPGLHFRRQAPIGPYIADFACLSEKLIVEADGGQHGGEADHKRDDWLEQNGYRILRVWNNDILENPEGVSAQLNGFMEASNHPTPTLPSRGGSPVELSPSPSGEGRGGGQMSAASILIGPEGGFSPQERTHIRALKSAIPVKLGPRILRADTAALAALTLWQSVCGDWSRDNKVP